VHRQGHQVFVDEVTGFGDPRLTSIAERVAAPPRVCVRGRDGVGRGTVATALAGAGVTVTDELTADVTVVVIAEAVKPEDRTMLAAPGPSVLVLNKADLAGFGGPMATARRRAVQYRAMTGVPTVPMAGLLATAALDDELIAALRTLACVPADLSSTDAFRDADHRLTRDVRARLLDTLDRFGIAQTVAAIAQAGEHVDKSTLQVLLRRLSNVDEVVAQLADAGAEVRYRRVCAALAEMRAMSVETGDERLAEFLAGDGVVIGEMAAAVDVVEAAGLTVDPGDCPSAHLRRAVHWRRYRHGPVDALHRSCGAAILRGSLRLLQRQSGEAR
jgi:hypothetical protein